MHVVKEVIPLNRISGFLKEAGPMAKARAEPAPLPLRLSLVDGQLEIDGEQRRIPVGVGRFLNGSQLKALCAKYTGLLLFVLSSGAWQRVGDKDVVELSDDTRLKTERPPVVRTAPRFHAD